MELGVQLARQLAKVNGATFEPTRYENGYAKAVGEYLTAFMDGQAPKAPPVRKAVESSPSQDLAALLQGSLAAVTPSKKKGKAA